MNEIKSFSFYRNYYELIKYLPDNDRLELYDAILNYIFDDKEPEFNDLKKGIWVNLKMPLDTSKNNAGRGGRPKKENAEIKTVLKPKKNRIKTEKKTNNNFLFLISNISYLKDKGLLREKIEEWLEYKKERKDKPYTEIGFKKLLKQIENNANEYGEEPVIDLIDTCMSNNYQGIIFDKLKSQRRFKEEKPTPSWFGQEFKEEDELSEEDKEFIRRVEGRN